MSTLYYGGWTNEIDIHNNFSIPFNYEMEFIAVNKKFNSGDLDGLYYSGIIIYYQLGYFGYISRNNYVQYDNVDYWNYNVVVGNKNEVLDMIISTSYFDNLSPTERQDIIDKINSY